MNLVDALIKGCNLDVRASLTSSAAKLLKQYLFKHSKEPEHIILTMTKNFDLDIKIKTP